MRETRISKQTVRMSVSWREEEYPPRQQCLHVLLTGFVSEAEDDDGAFDLPDGCSDYDDLGILVSQKQESFQCQEVGLVCLQTMKKQSMT